MLSAYEFEKPYKGLDQGHTGHCLDAHQSCLPAIPVLTCTDVPHYAPCAGSVPFAFLLAVVLLAPVVCPPLSLPAAHSSTLNHGCTPTCRHWYSVSLSYSYHHHGHHNCDQLLPVLCIVIPRHHQICTTCHHP